MSELLPTSSKNEPGNFSYLELCLNNQMAARKADVKFDIEGGKDSFGYYELGFSVDDVVSLINNISSTKKPRALIISGVQHTWTNPEERCVYKIKKILPPIEREKGFEPEVVKALAHRANLLQRKTPETIIYSRDVDGYPNSEGKLVKVIYNIFPLELPNLQSNIYWHELILGEAYVGNSLDVLVTVNKRYIPTTSKSPLINRLILLSQGV